MKLSRDWLNDYVDLSDLSDEQLGTRFTEIGHAVESIEKHDLADRLPPARLPRPARLIARGTESGEVRSSMRIPHP